MYKLRFLCCFFHFAGRLPSFMLQTKINSINYNRKRKERELKLPLVITKGLHINAALSASNTVIFDDCVTVLLSIFLCSANSRELERRKRRSRGRLTNSYFMMKLSRWFSTPPHLSKHYHEKEKLN